MHLVTNRLKGHRYLNYLHRATLCAKIPQNNNLQGFIENYQTKGHIYAKIDPLGLANNTEKDHSFDLEHWQLSEIENVKGFPFDYRLNEDYTDHCTTVGELKEHLDKLYTESVGVEFSHIENEEERLWLYKNYESVMAETMTKAE